MPPPLSQIPHPKRLLKIALLTCAAALLYNALNSLTDEAMRQLSISYGNGDCKWTPPNYEVPEDIAWHKTLIVGFPSGDKRLTFVQLEALTGWPTKDEWDFEFL